MKTVLKVVKKVVTVVAQVVMFTDQVVMVENHVGMVMKVTYQMVTVIASGDQVLTVVDSNKVERKSPALHTMALVPRG